MNEQNKKDQLNEVWADDVLTDLIERMLIYYDPWELIILGTPDDEYDFSVPQIKTLYLQKNHTVESLRENLSKILEPDFTPPQDLERTITRMAEDLIFLKESWSRRHGVIV